MPCFGRVVSGVDSLMASILCDHGSISCVNVSATCCIYPICRPSCSSFEMDVAYGEAIHEGENERFIGHNVALLNTCVVFNRP